MVTVDTSKWETSDEMRDNRAAIIFTLLVNTTSAPQISTYRDMKLFSICNKNFLKKDER